MSAKRKEKKTVVNEPRRGKNDKIVMPDAASQQLQKQGAIVADHLPPLPLVVTILLCSGFMFVLGMRDLMTTGKVILGESDAAYLDFTKSCEWFEDLKGWKSTQGGFSAVNSITTDDNDMGGFFVRKVAGAAMMGTHLHKLIPILFHPYGAKWKGGHFRPLLLTAAITNIIVLFFLGLHAEDLVNAGAEMMVWLMMGSLALETTVVLSYLIRQKVVSRGPAIAMPEGKSEKSVPSRILARTVMVVSGFISVIAGRDFFYPGYILPFPPRDEIYLEWTGAFLHSPPEGSVEAHSQGLSSSLYVGQLYIAQWMALHVLILCFYKFASTFFIRFGSDGSGTIKAKMMWVGAFCGDAMFLFVLRLFSPPALSASLDLRWHLMSVGYEALILGLYAYK